MRNEIRAVKTAEACEKKSWVSDWIRQARAGLVSFHRANETYYSDQYSLANWTRFLRRSDRLATNWKERQKAKKFVRSRCVSPWHMLHDWSVIGWDGKYFAFDVLNFCLLVLGAENLQRNEIYFPSNGKHCVPLWAIKIVKTDAGTHRLSKSKANRLRQYVLTAQKAAL